MRQISLLCLLVGLSSGCSSLRFKSTEEVRSLGEEAYAEGKYDGAVPYYDELLRRDDDDTRARLVRARIRDKTGNTLAAKTDYSVVVTKDDQDVRGRLYRAELAIRTGDTATAQNDLESLNTTEGLEIYDRVAVLKFLGVVQSKSKNYSLASMFYRQAIAAGAGASDPLALRHVAEAHYNLGECLFYGNEFRESHSNFRQYERLAPEVGITVTPEDYYHLAITAYLSDDFRAAMAYFPRSDPGLRKRASVTLGDPGIMRKQFH